MELLERDIPLRELDAALKDAVGGEGRVALVSGEAGIGKTSLVERFTHIHYGSTRILWGACDSLFTPRPLGPLHDITMQLESELPALLNSNANRQAIFSACLVELQSRPTIVVFEDVHWADEATLDLIKFLGRRIQRTVALFILTYRDDELGAGHPLRLTLGDLPRGTTTRLQLPPLSKSSVFALAHAANQGERAEELFDTTNGNPFFVTEALASKDVSGVPATVRDAVLARAARLSRSARAVLEGAAVIGSKVEPWLLSEVTRAEASYTDECISAGMLQTQNDALVFRHELARQCVLESISPQQRIALHRMTLNALKESPQMRNDLARLANHAAGTNDAEAVLDYVPAAARQASAASSHREAAALYELALRFADALLPAEHAQMLEAYAAELEFMERNAEEIIVLEKTIDLWHSIDNRIREGVNLAELADSLYDAGQQAKSEEASRSAIAMLEALSPSIELARAYRSRCYVRMMHRDCAEAVVWGEKAIALAERFEDVDTLARAYNYLGCATLLINYERGRALMERSLAVGRENNLTFAVAGTLGNLGLMLVEVYQLADADSYLTEGIAYAAEHDDDYHLWEMVSWQALVRLYQGRWVEAVETARSVPQHPSIDNITRIGALLTLGRLLIRRGEADALTALDEALALSTKMVTISRPGAARAAWAEAAWLAGDNDRAIEEARALYDTAVGKEHPWVAGELAFWRWRAGDDVTPPEWIATPFALQIAGDWRGAAEDWEGRGCPYEQAMALMDGDQAGQIRALEIFEGLGARPASEIVRQKLQAIPARRLEKEKFGGLSVREREVAALIAQGKSNREIAEALVVGVRTVETYVTRILNKLGFDSRVQIATWAVEKGLVSTNKT